MIWNYAGRNGFVIVTKDSDFRQLSFLYGAPPKVVWMRLGNCSTDLIETVLRTNAKKISIFMKDEAAALLTLEP
jgi:predicted nuclease of predicted toxin-antitoxin system